MAEPTTLATRLAERMEAAGLNPYSTAKRAGVGGDYIRDIMRGKVRQPSADKLTRVATALGTSLQYLLGLDEDAGGAARSLFDPAPTEHSVNKIARLLPIRGSLMGATFKSTALPDPPPLGFEAGSLPPEFDGREAWYEYLQDDSQDRFIPAGSLILVVSVPDDFFPADGDWVVTEKTMRYREDDLRPFMTARERSLRRVERIYRELPLLFLEFNSRSGRFPTQDEVISIPEEMETNRRRRRDKPSTGKLSSRREVTDDQLEHFAELDRRLNDPEEFSKFIGDIQAARAKIIGKAIRFVTPLTSLDTFGVHSELYFGADPEK